MKVKLLLLIFLLQQGFVTNAQEKSDWQKSGLLGKVKTQTIEKATLTAKPAGSIKEHRVPFSTISFDNKGNGIENIQYNPDGTLQSKFGWKVVYDSKEREIEKHYFDANGMMTAKSLSFYNEKGGKAETFMYSPLEVINHILKFSYDAKGNQTEEIMHYPHLSITNKSVIINDDNGNEIERIVYQTDGTVSRRHLNTYDDKGRRLSWILYNENKVPIIHWSHSYNEKGDRKENFYYNRDGKLYMKETISYKYDSIGNWVKSKIEREIYKDGQTVKETEILYRRLTYY